MLFLEHVRHVLGNQSFCLECSSPICYLTHSLTFKKNVRQKNKPWKDNMGSGIALKVCWQQSSILTMGHKPHLGTTLSCSSPIDLITVTVYHEQDALWLADLILMLVGPFYRWPVHMTCRGYTGQLRLRFFGPSLNPLQNLNGPSTGRFYTEVNKCANVLSILSMADSVWTSGWRKVHKA